MGDTTETNTNVLSGELFFRCGSTTNTYTEKSLYARNGLFSQVLLSHIYTQKSMKVQQCVRSLALNKLCHQVLYLAMFYTESLIWLITWEELLCILMECYN